VKTLSVALIAGIGAALAPALVSRIAGLRPEQAARATNTGRVLQQVGGSVGVAVLAVGQRQPPRAALPDRR